MKTTLFALALLTALFVLVGRNGAPAVVVGDSIAAEIDGDAGSKGGGVPRRVVPASLLAEDLLLGVLPKERWVGISFVVDWASSTPSSAKFDQSIPRVNGTAESILALAPDLVVLSDYNQASTVSQLKEAGIAVHLVRSPRNFDELFGEWRKLGDALGLRAETERAIEPYAEKLGRLRRDAPKLSVLLLQGRFSYARGSLHDGCLRHLGLENVLAGTTRGATPELGTEELSTLEPDLVFVPARLEAPRRAKESEFPAELPYANFPKRLTPAVYFFPDALLGSISQHVIDACAEYGRVANEVSREKATP